MGIAQAAYRVIPANSVGGDATENPPHIRMAGMSFGQVKGMLRFQGVRHIVAFEFFFLIKEKNSRVGATVYIGQA